MKLVPDTSVSSMRSSRRLILLAPALAEVPDAFCNAESDRNRHSELLTGMQRFRGEQYIEDGAISRDELTADGRHYQRSDHHAWHILLLGGSGEILGCSRCVARYGMTPFSDLGVAHSALAICDKWGHKFSQAVEQGITEAAREGFGSGELGGWAISPQMRCSTEVLRNALSMWALTRLLGIKFSFTTATRRHCSASILRKIGGRSFVLDGVEIPHYYDPQYDCDMEALQFEDPIARLEPWVQELQQTLSMTPVWCAARHRGDMPRELAEFPGDAEVDLLAHA